MKFIAARCHSKNTICIRSEDHWNLDIGFEIENTQECVFTPLKYYAFLQQEECILGTYF